METVNLGTSRCLRNTLVWSKFVPQNYFTFIFFKHILFTYRFQINCKVIVLTTINRNPLSVLWRSQIAYQTFITFFPVLVRILLPLSRFIIPTDRKHHFNRYSYSIRCHWVGFMLRVFLLLVPSVMWRC